MLLTFIRLTMIVPLLVSAVCVEANPEKLPFVPSEKESKVVAQPRRRNDAFVKEKETPSVHDEDSGLVEEDDQLNKNDRYSGDGDTRVRRGSVHQVENRFPRSGGGGLAHKMAKDALKSPKVQATISKLSHVASSKGGVRGTGKSSRVGKGNGKAYGGKRRRSGKGHKGRRKKKKKRHHRRSRKRYLGVPRGGSSKRTLASKRDVSLSDESSDGQGGSMIERDRVTFDDKSREKSSDSGSKDKTIAVKVDDNDYVDFSTAPNTDSSGIRTTESQKVDGSANVHENESMIELLMKTTTKDPLRRNSGDQGIEYSDYYSDDEVLQDIAANKIPVEAIESGNSNDRSVREALNSPSYSDRDQIHRSNRYYRDYDPRRKKLEQGARSVNSLNDFQKYTSERLPSLRRRSRLIGVDDPSRSYPSYYGSPENGIENSGTSYVANAEKVPEQQSQAPEESSDSRSNLDPSDWNKFGGEIQQPPFDAQNTDRFDRPNQYDRPRHKIVNINEAVEPKAPQLPDRGENFDANQLLTDDTKVPSVREDVEVRTQSSYTPVQLYNNEEQQGEQVSNNFPARSRYNLNIPNAMDQPLGKILETLGINVNGGSNGINQYPSLNENINHPVMPYYTLDHPIEHVISPSYLKKHPQEDTSSYYEANNARDYQTAEPRNRNSAKEGFSRRQSVQDKEYNSDIMPHLYKDKNSTDNMNISTAVQDTREVATQILDTIMEELEELKTDRSKNDKREGLPCRLSGSWSTAQAGMKLDMRVVNRSIIVTLSDLASPRFHESLLNGTWNVSGHAPYKRGSPFTLMATDNNTNSMAVFVGACRVCQGVDTIAGVWSVARQPKDCRDFQVSTSVFNDIFRKTKLSSLKENKGTNATEETTQKHEKRKS